MVEKRVSREKPSTDLTSIAPDVSAHRGIKIIRVNENKNRQ